MPIEHQSSIKINVGLDENRIPEEIKWSAEDGNINNKKTDAFILSVWDRSSKDTFGINLWTKDMPVNEMKQFIHQSLLSLKNTYQNATGDEKLSNSIQDFCDYFLQNMSE